MSQVSKCANYDCNNELSEFELEKIKSFRSIQRSKYEFCIDCRRKIKEIIKIKCKQCDNPFTPKTLFKQKCPECLKSNEKNRMRGRHVIHHDDSQINRVRIALINGVVIDEDNVESQFEMPLDKFKKIISMLKWRYKIKTRKTILYRLEELQ